jgi:hypothetical protein
MRSRIRAGLESRVLPVSYHNWKAFERADFAPDVKVQRHGYSGVDRSGLEMSGVEMNGDIREAASLPEGRVDNSFHPSQARDIPYQSDRSLELAKVESSFVYLRETTVEAAQRAMKKVDREKKFSHVYVRITGSGGQAELPT